MSRLCLAVLESQHATSRIWQSVAVIVSRMLRVWVERHWCKSYRPLDQPERCSSKGAATTGMKERKTTQTQLGIPGIWVVLKNRIPLGVHLLYSGDLNADPNSENYPYINGLSVPQMPEALTRALEGLAPSLGSLSQVGALFGVVGLGRI